MLTTKSKADKLAVRHAMLEYGLWLNCNAYTPIRKRLDQIGEQYIIEAGKMVTSNKKYKQVLNEIQ